jgi:hypothetical protein
MTKGEVVDPFGNLTDISIHTLLQLKCLVEVKLFEPQEYIDSKQKTKYHTKTVSNNGFNPIWNEVFEFQMNCFSLSFLRFVCYGPKDLAQPTILNVC